MAFEEDTAAFVDQDGPGVSAASWTHSAVTATVYGYFNAPYQDVALGLAGMSAQNATFDCRAADVPAAAEGDTLVIDGTSYSIASDLQPLDDGAFVRIPLKG